MSLCKILDIDQTKCKNCHTCISVCPIKYCFKNDKTVSIIDDLCIGCGKCYQACPHNAINIIDDFQYFIESINRGEKSILIVSPAILTAFKDNYNKLLTYLKETWALSGIFDEGLGAELSSILNVKYIKNIGKIPLISQHCPTIIEYIKIYHPELLEHTSPFYSPTVILSKLIRHKLNFKGNIAYLGPCLSKRREFKDPDTNNLIQFNLTIENLTKYLELRKTDLSKYKNSFFDFEPSERGCVFCKPGGLINIVKRNYKTPEVYHYEGNELYNKYFKKLSTDIENNSNHLSLLIDLLNCEGGCFRGPAGKNNLSLDDETWYIEKKEYESLNIYNNKSKAQKTFENILNNNKKIDFSRFYISERKKAIQTLNDQKLMSTYKSLKMHENNDFLDCRSCGFNTCKEFATAVYSDLNSIENCKVYMKKHLENIISKKYNISNDVISTSNTIEINSNSIMKLTEKIKYNFENLERNITNIKNVNLTLKNNSEQLEPIVIAISEISEQINLLSLNASIEASRTGETGKGFSVISTEIRKLADKTKSETDNVLPIMKSIINDANILNKDIENISTETTEYTESISNLHSYIEKVNIAINSLVLITEKLTENN